MEKVTNSRIMARRSIFWRTAVLNQVIGAVILLIGMYVFKVRELSFLFGCVFVPVLLSMLITFIRMKLDDDGDIVKKWELNRQKNYSNAKKRYLDAVDNVKSTYTLVSASPTRTKSGEFKLSFSSKIHPKATPIVNLNGIQMTLQSFEDNIAVYYSRVIKNYANIMFSIGEVGWNIDNPYLFNLEKEHIRWQVTGHTIERNVFLNGIAFSHPNVDVSYDFEIKINKETFGPFKGTYDDEQNIIEIPIGHIKNNCKSNKCILVPVWNRELALTMPCPEALSVNHVKKYEKMFPGKTQTA